jgi:hypothetical protein
MKAEHLSHHRLRESQQGKWSAPAGWEQPEARRSNAWFVHRFAHKMLGRGEIR